MPCNHRRHRVFQSSVPTRLWSLAAAVSWCYCAVFRCSLADAPATFLCVDAVPVGWPYWARASLAAPATPAMCPADLSRLALQIARAGLLSWDLYRCLWACLGRRRAGKSAARHRVAGRAGNVFIRSALGKSEPDQPQRTQCRFFLTKCVTMLKIRGWA